MGLKPASKPLRSGPPMSQLGHYLQRRYEFPVAQFAAHKLLQENDIDFLGIKPKLKSRRQEAPPSRTGEK
jgi:hypothetical protein